MDVRNPLAEPTVAQVSFLKRLIAERAVSEAPVADDLATLDQWLARGANRGQVSAMIERVKGLPRRTEGVAPLPTLTEGMYVTDAGIFRVYKARGGSHMLVKRLIGSDETGYSYQYEGRAARIASYAGLRRMSLDEAKGWGRRTGSCCVCARHLTDGESIDKGIGPRCEGRV